MEKTHYRKAFNSPYLSSADIVEPVVLTVSHVRLEGDKSKKTKDSFNTLYFSEKEIRKGEPLKPMVLNAGNSKIMAKLADSSFIDDWSGINITIYVDKNVRFGRDTVEGLRINTTPAKKELTQSDPMWGKAIQSYKKEGNFHKITTRMNISKENMELIKNLAGDK